MAGLPRHKLTVTSRTPGQPVFVNGFPLGKTPFEKSMVSGTYSVVVGEPHRHAFVRQVVLQADTVLEVEPEREAGFRREHGPCFEAGADREERLSLISALAPALGVDDVIAVRLESLGGEQYLAAALVEVSRGREVREGRVRLEQSTLPKLADLARFALTGEGKPGAVESVDLSPGFWNDDGRGGSSKWLPTVGWVLAGATAVLGGVAVYEHWRAGDQQADAETLLKNGALSHLDKPEYDRLQADAASARKLRNILAIGAGATAVGAGVAFGLMLLPGERAGEPTLAAAVTGSF
ncbi:MAG: PEGA domain-containing protein [Myxococcales bacterium]